MMTINVIVIHCSVPRGRGFDFETAKEYVQIFHR